MEEFVIYTQLTDTYTKFYHDYLISRAIVKTKPTKYEHVLYSLNFFFNGGFNYEDDYLQKKGLKLPIIDRIGITYTDKPLSNSKKITIIPPQRYKYYNIPIVDLFPIFIRQKTLMNLVSGNQFSLFSDEEISTLKNEGFNIEVFGSSYNTRLQYFGSLYTEDRPLGRLGTAEEILEKILAGDQLYWYDEAVRSDKFTLSPPSGRDLIEKTVKYCIEILQKHKVYLILAIPESNNHCEILHASEFCIKAIKKTKAYCFNEHKEIDLSKTPWIDFHMRS